MGETPRGSLLNVHKSSSQILVSVLNPLSPKKAPVEEPVEDQTQPTITLEVPGFTYPTGCLSPIMEMQTPLATPCPSPLPTPLLTRNNARSPSQEEASDSSNSGYISSGGGFKKLMAKAKTIPVPRMTGLAQTRTSPGSADSFSYDSGDAPELVVSDFSEISIPIPSPQTSSSSTETSQAPMIPIILTSIYDSSENICKPQDEETKRRSPSGERKLVKQGNIPQNIIIPQVSVSFEDDLDENTSEQTKSPLSSSPSSTSSSPHFR